MSFVPRSPERRRRLIALVSAFLLAVLGLTASAARATTTPRTWVIQVGQQTSSGSIQGMSYGTPSIWIDKGDSIRWVAASMEIHTVSFINASHPAVPFNPAVIYEVAPTPQTWISAPGQFRNSGVMSTMADPALGPTFRTYTLKFTGVGTYRYLCYVHGQAMTGTVFVRAAGTPYPRTQAQYNLAATNLKASILEHGLNMWSTAFSHATSNHVLIGASDMRSMLMRYVSSTVNIAAGESVRFDMGANSIPVPHTVTFGTEPQNPAITVGNPAAYGGGDLSSGILLPPNFGPPGSSTYTVTFTTPGTYHYKCMFHDGMGMVGTVIVH